MELMSPLVRLVCYHLNVLIYLQSEVYKNSVATSLKVTSITKRLLGDPRIKYSSEVKKKALGKLKNESVSEIVCFHHFLI